MKNLLTLLFIGLAINTEAQTGFKVDEANSNRTPDASAIFDAEATTKGILIPQLSLTATNLATPVTTPSNSLLIFNTATTGTGATAVTPGYYYWDTLTDEWIRLFDPTNNVVTIDSAEWVDGSIVGLTPGDIYARKALLNNDTTVIKGSGAYSGSIGIGVPNPTARLHVRGNSKFIGNGGVVLSTRNDAGDKGLDISNGSAYIDFTSSANRWFINRLAPTRLDINKGGGSVNIGKSLGTYPAVLVVRGRTDDASDNAFMVTDSNDFPTQALLTVRNDGFVGIGTATPLNKFYVENDEDATKDSSFIITEQGRVGIGFDNPTLGTLQVRQKSDNSNDGITVTNAASSTGLRLWVDASNKGRIDAAATGAADLILNTGGGEIGIGTTNPQGKFHIENDQDATKDSVFIVRNNGHVGLGTVSPTSKLDIEAPSQDFGALEITTPNTSTSFYEDADLANYLNIRKVTGKGMVFTVRADRPNLVVKDTLDGVIGMGTLMPENNLYLYVGSMGSSAEKGLTIEAHGNSGTGRGVQIQFKTGTSGLNSQKSGAIKVTRYNAGSGTDMSFYTRNDAGDSTQAMLIDDNGNIGIGSSTPLGKLHVGNDQDGNYDSVFVVATNGKVGVGTISPTGQLTANESIPGFANQLRLENDSSDVNTAWRIRIPGNGTGRDGSLEFVTGAASPNLVIEAGGNVGIGLTNPTEALEVVGNVRASGNFISGGVTMNVPDYVFETYYKEKSSLNEDYTFKSLEEIEAYTKENNHLPGIPSANEIKEKDQFDLTQSSLNNLEKIEEIFLHLIILNKENISLKEEVKLLKKENEKVKTLKQEIKNIKKVLEELQKND